MTPGFHGDEFLLRVVDKLARKADYFIETGTNIGITLNYVARTYPKLRCLSCEPNPEAARHATQLVQDCENATVFTESSQRFMQRLAKNKESLFNHVTMFWLDAHGHGFTWPLREEIAFISKNIKKGFILIDDFKVPNKKEFNFNSYKHQQCSFEFIKCSLDPKKSFNLYYPNYTTHTSKFHPLVGWGLLQFGSRARLDKQLTKEIEWVAK